MKRNILILALIVSSCVISAQDSQFNVEIPRTPTAASLGKYGDIPVSYHTGVPNISIPIYTVQEGNLTLPISFSYHSSGIKINETASWVGLGWTLNAGGMISRTVIGGRDEGITSGIISGNASDEAGWGWYKDNGLFSKILTPDLGDPNNQPAGSSRPDTATRSYHRDAAKGLVDSEPDIYTYNFGGYIGKFLFDDDRNAYTIPREDLLIEPDNNESQGEYFNSWKITTPDGTKYYFGGLATELNYSFNNLVGEINQQYNTATTWYLYKIESVNGNKWISLEYEDEEYSVGDRLSHSIICGNGVSCSPLTSHTVANQYIMLNKVKGKRLSKITTSSGNIEIEFIESSSLRTDLSKFSSSSGYEVNDDARYLSEIIIEDDNDNPIRKFVLDMDYFTSSSSSGYPSYPTLTHDLNRLKLESIQEFNGDDTESKPPYEFTYNSTQMARRFSLACDYWGYYNGATTNQGLIPNGIQNPCNGTTLNGGANRSVSETHMKAWILEKIKYPTGGETNFSYEKHQYNNGDPTLADIGGLRIAKITKVYGNNQPDVEIEYEYSDARLYTPDPYKNSNSFFWQDPNLMSTVISGHGPSVFGEYLNAAPRSPLYSTQGFHIGYMTVKEIFSDDSYNHYIYTGEAFSSSSTFPEIPPQNPIGRGQLTTTYLKESDDSYDSYESNNYTTSTNDISIAAKKVAALICSHPNHTSDFLDRTYCAVTDYSIKTRRHNLLTKTSYRDGVITTTNFTYATSDDHGNPIATEATQSNGKTTRNEFLYPGDAGSGAPVQMYDASNSNYKHMPGVVIQQTTKVNTSPVSKVLNNYAYDSGEDEIHPISTATFPTGSSEYVSVSYGFDDYENIETITKSDGVVDSYYWGYNHSLPVAKIINAEIDNTHEIVSQTRTDDYNNSGNISSWTDLGSVLTPDHDQNIDVKITVEQVGGTGASCGVRLLDSDDNEVFSGTYGPGETTLQRSVQAGESYQYQFTISMGSAYRVFLYIETDYEYTNIENNIIYESFEEDENASTSYAKTGEKSNYGAYTLDLYADPGTYILSYWQKSSSSASWVYHESELVNPPDTYIIASTGQYTDEIRFYPKGSQMETYTHDPGVGVTSITDVNNQTTYYEYDEFGRIIEVTDPNGNLVQEVEYNYVNQ